MEITQSRNKREGKYTGYHSVSAAIRTHWKSAALKARVFINKQNLREEIMAEKKGLLGYAGQWTAVCCVCERDYELVCSVAEFDPDFSYCGGSPSCVP